MPSGLTSALPEAYFPISFGTGAASLVYDVSMAWKSVVTHIMKYSEVL